jgi:hypothetical protein
MKQTVRNPLGPRVVTIVGRQLDVQVRSFANILQPMKAKPPMKTSHQLPSISLPNPFSVVRLKNLQTRKKLFPVAEANPV